MARSPIIHGNLAHLLLAVLLICSMPLLALAGKAEHVILVVWDGLRPDCISEHDTPTLWRLRQQGVFFSHHRAVYPSATQVNGAAIATGGIPGNNGILANNVYRPDINIFGPVVSDLEFVIYMGNRLSGDRYVRMPTMAEIVRKAGRRVAVGGTKEVARFQVPRFPSGRPADPGSIIIAGRTFPSALIDEIWTEFAPFPLLVDPKRRANAPQDDWTTRVLLEKFWHPNIPALTVLWLCEPDFAQHGAGPGSKVARAAIKSCDDNLARVLTALEAAGARDKTDILVVSDHGFSTIGYTVDVVEELKKAGLKAVSGFTSAPIDGDILVVGQGGSVCFYVIGHVQDVIDRLVRTLQTSEYAGVIFSQRPIEGTFSFQQAGIDATDAPDVVMSMRWWGDTNASGLPGMLASEGTKRGRNEGGHASLSPFDMSATLIATGPDFKDGLVTVLPSGNTDIAPTVCWLLNIKPEAAMDGRLLSEAIIDGPAVKDQAEPMIMEATRKIGELTWRQYLKMTKLGRWNYYEEGNGGVSAR